MGKIVELNTLMLSPLPWKAMRNFTKVAWSSLFPSPLILPFPFGNGLGLIPMLQQTLLTLTSWHAWKLYILALVNKGLWTPSIAMPKTHNRFYFLPTLLYTSILYSERIILF